ncbi:MAG: tRNA (adenosine(37)-N6)-threonylcarbamoyltransferase complex ATPase subunit type 1 TsaE [Limimaricola sp.]|uniref:tRNA (adenosine(37)-N6)-threonylcarbamoyltransferase complex ATPase subunit type 1 TsaE n=1 Tax=Limimaricola sp. TaxID=2211665 RepID=UPI001D30D5C5|nr:tRNA (adenosine(37)-N6)-threonylcarbamoyltransferase complex ATPase subunit type 1 TsaE [Limimaricola sp.]MBI1417238.1 tRNA (adenosine(37)-N6)-threonylcarbamoyltransferase complex ATPase subunit type 1 TsaE [Limimaricola sp.]
MPQAILTAEPVDEAAMAALARQIAPRLKPGDCLLLDGPIGAGKTAFARALIRARLGRDEDVPSPTFTLVQTYDDGTTEIWHCDLYRLTDVTELAELGLETALDSAICLIEWPDRMGTMAPQDALSLQFDALADRHRVRLSGSKAWAERLNGLRHAG